MSTSRLLLATLRAWFCAIVSPFCTGTSTSRSRSIFTELRRVSEEELSTGRERGGEEGRGRGGRGCRAGLNGRAVVIIV